MRLTSAFTGRSRPVRAGLAWALPLTVLAGGLSFVSPGAAQADVSATAPDQCLVATETEADAIAIALRCQTRVQIADATNETDEAFALPNGTVEFEHRYRPVRVERDGDWVPVDTTLQIQADGSVAPKAAAADVAFSGGGTDPMVSVENNDGEVALSSPWGALPTPTLAGNTATYREVRPGIDLRLTADVDGFSQVFVVKTRQAAKDPALNKLNFEMETDGLVVAANKTGNLKVVDEETGRLALTASTPVMWDSDTAAGTTPVAAASAETASDSDKARMPVTVGDDTMSITPDQKMLDAPATKFPVYVDPSFTTYRTGFVMVTASNPTSTYFNTADDALVGSNNGVNKWRTFFNFSTATAPFVGKQVTSADLRLQEKWSGSCTATPLDAYATYAGGSTTTWNNQPTWSTKQDTQTVAKGYSTSGMGGASACPAGEVRMDITPITQQAANNGTNITIGLRSPDETKLTYWKRFENNPKISVIYNNIPQPIAQQTGTTGSCVSGSTRPFLATTTPTLRASYQDDDGDPLTTTFEWWALSGSAAIGSASQSSVPAGSTATIAVPAGQLSSGGTYKWHVKSYDGKYTTGWSPSSWCEFTVDTTAPTAVPTVSSSTYPAGVTAGGPGVPGSFTFGANGISDVASFQYGLDANPPTTVVNATGVGGSATASIIPFTAGTHILYVRSRDRAGNLSPTTAYTFSVLNQAPTLTTRGVYIDGDGTQPSTSCVSGASRPVVNTLTPQLWATFSHSTLSTVSAEFEYARLDGTVLGTEQIAGAPTSQRAGVWIPQDKLVSGESYKWRVRANDPGSYATAPYSGWCEFAVRAVFTTPDLASNEGDGYEPLFDLDPLAVDSVPESAPANDFIPGVDDQPDYVSTPDTGETADEADPDETGIPVEAQQIESALDTSAFLPEDPQASAMSDALSEVCSSPEGVTVDAPDGSYDCLDIPPSVEEAPAVAVEDSEVDAEELDSVATASAESYSTMSYPEPGTTGNLPIPSGCRLQHYLEWRVSRYTACFREKAFYFPTDIVNGVTVSAGFVTFDVYRYARQSPTKKTWDYHVYLHVLSVYSAKGTRGVAGARAESVSASCPQSCAVYRPEAGGAFDKFDLWVELTALVDMPPQWSSNKRRVAQVGLTFKVTRPLSAAVKTVTVLSNYVRCDQALKGSSTVGCVVPNFIPSLKYHKTGKYPDLANHIYAAQQSQLAGRPGPALDGQPGSERKLTRLYDDSLIGKNRRRSCPSGLRDKEGAPKSTSCDEYPFASTYQGAYVVNRPVNNPRTFKFCHFREVDKDFGPNGFSRCFINATQNSTGGSALGHFYSERKDKEGRYFGMRLLDGDGFYVRIDP
ncbi:hypothetical protein AB0368_33145 [Actinoplanes sp. NPDC051475]|uniref:NucA/NucB deoxyribonuclease domain-containing protein n=1 Tax=Actinoplanes sp. NPDC051475 TaxID=3157225 RepID=UPI00344B19F8